MSRIFTLFFAFTLLAATVSVVDATEQSNATIINGVRVEKEITSSKGYVYWSFTNNNSYPVEVTYTIANYPSGTVVLNSGEKKRSYSAYYEEYKCMAIVKRVSTEDAKRMSGKSGSVESASK